MTQAAVAPIAPALRAELSPAIAAAVVAVHLARSVAGPLVELLPFVEASGDDDAEAQLELATDAGWERWGAAVDALAAVPAMTIADVEAKFRAASDNEPPGGLHMFVFRDGVLASIGRDLQRLSQY